MPQLHNALILAFTAFACIESPAPTGQAAEELAKGESLCVQSFVKQRECTNTFIPALVGLRVELDAPSGIRDVDSKEGRSALVLQATEEWREDSKDDAIRSTCARITQKIRPDAKMNAASAACLAKTSCTDFVPCELELIRPHLQ